MTMVQRPIETPVPKGDKWPTPGRQLQGAVIGFGRMGLTHYAILNTHPRVRFVGICDESSFMRKNIRDHLRIEPYDDYRKLVSRPDLDFVIVATPTGMHGQVVLAALECGLHVFVEKPFVLGLTEGATIVAEAERRQLVNQVGYVVRFNDVICQVRKLVVAGALGELLHYKMEAYGSTVLKGAKTWRAKRQEGGGCLYDFASHSIDLMNQLFGAPLRVTGSVAQKIYSHDVEDAIYTSLIYSGKLRGTLLVNWSDPTYRKPTYRLEILGRNGKLIADLHAYKVFFVRDPPAGFNVGWNTRYITDFAEPVRTYLRGYEFTRQLDYFIDCIDGRRPASMCTFADGHATDRVIESIAIDAQSRSIDNG